MAGAGGGAPGSPPRRWWSVRSWRVGKEAMSPDRAPTCWRSRQPEGEVKRDDARRRRTVTWPNVMMFMDDAAGAGAE